MESEDEIPKYIVDLSRPPEERYNHIAPHFRSQVESCDLPRVFHDLLCELGGGTTGAKYLDRAAQLALRRVYSREETAEIRGIAKAVGISLHILVAFNVLLDLLLGCTSGGARVIDSKQPSLERTPRMLHFRTLDWGMEPLRKIVLQLDYVRVPGGPVVATSITYLGYVGVLTGVKQGLSMSLNFRPHHSRDTWRERIAFRSHQALVVLGFRQSISSVMRNFLLAEDGDMASILSTLSSSASTAAYLIFCTPERVYVVEKDHNKALIKDSDTFLAAYNHDTADEDDPARLESAAQDLPSDEDAIGMADLVRFSLDRKAHMDNLWAKRVRACRRHHWQHGDVVTQQAVFRFLGHPEIRNDETHYAVVMDPTSGSVMRGKVYHIVDGDEQGQTTAYRP